MRCGSCSAGSLKKLAAPASASVSSERWMVPTVAEAILP